MTTPQDERVALEEHLKTAGDCRLRKVWYNMIFRCKNPKYHSFHRYGGRGIAVCEEWKSFDSFKEWALKNGYGPGLTIDRVDDDGDYEPTNCRFVTMHEQARNRCTNRYITACGQTMTVTDWAKARGINVITLFKRLERGEDVLSALNRRVKK